MNIQKINYVSKDFELEVSFDFENKTVWLTTSEISKIAGESRQRIAYQINKRFDENDSEWASNAKKFCQPTNGKEVIFYNLFVLKEIGRSFKNERISQFVEWANNLLGSYEFEKWEITRFTLDNVSIDVKVSPDESTVWLTQSQMAELFDTSIPNISIHISKIFEDCELNESSVIKFYLNTGNDGKAYVTGFYNLDLILSVGYRVNSKRGIAFRRWASKVLSDYLLKGIAINEKRLHSLGKTVDIQNRMLSASLNIDYQELSSVVNEYTQALDLLDDYDHQSLAKPKGRETIYQLTYEDSRSIIDKMKFTLSSDLFGVEKEEGKLEGIIAAVFQHVFGTEVYPSLEDKAAHLLYFLVKDHPFYDGCKRIAATLFLEYLNRNGALVRNGKLTISNDALVAITLLTAESDPKEMDVIVSVIMNLLVM